MPAGAQIIGTRLEPETSAKPAQALEEHAEEQQRGAQHSSGDPGPRVLGSGAETPGSVADAGHPTSSTVHAR